MKKSIFKNIFTLALTTICLSSCVNDDSYDVPENTLKTYELTPTIAVNQIVATSTPVLYTADDIIEAYVTSSDEKGTFYKSISFQDLKNTATTIKGFSVPLNITTLYGKGFTPGRKVYIKLKGLYVANVFGSLQIGSLFEGEIGRIAENVWQNHLLPSATIVPESDLVRPFSLSAAYADVNQNTLIDLSPVQFDESSINRTYYDVDSGGGATNHAIIATSGGSSRILRMSSFSPFSGNIVPSGSGTIRGVLTKYDTDFQFIVRYESDFKLISPRVDVFPPIVGNAIQYLGAFTENFESYTAGSATTGQNNFPKYVNDPVVGSKTWRTRTSSGTKYIEMSSFGNPVENNRTLFIVPVDMTAANNLSFKTRTNFYNGETLKVYYSTNYVPGSAISSATLVNITSNFTFSTANTSTASFTNSGVYSIPTSVTGNGFFIFEYTGSGLTSPTLTTNMQIDDIVVN